MAKVYECRNASCSLGTVGNPGGRFTGGMTAEAKTLLTGQPAEHMKKDEDYGEGICPNCGQKGKVV